MDLIYLNAMYLNPNTTSFSVYSVHQLHNPIVFTYLHEQAYTSQIVVMAMMALAVGDDTISSQVRREAIIDGLFDLPSMICFLNSQYMN